MPNFAKVWNETKKVIVCEHCFIAKTWWHRFWGLMGRRNLERTEGLFLTPARGGIHTCFMRFAIDVVYLNGEGKVVAVRYNMKPWRIWIVTDKDAVSVLELPAGRLSETKTEVGDLLKFFECD